jgi:hypothetical protein
MDWRDALAIAGFVIALVGVPLAYILARRSRQKPTLRWAIDFDVLIAPEDGLLSEGFSMEFRGEEISRVSRTYVAIWNKRGDTVRGSDILTSDPIRLQLDSSDIALQTRVALCSREQIGFMARPVENSVEVSFDFLDEGDGAIVEVLHCASLPPAFVGTVRGASLGGGEHLTLTPSALQWMQSDRLLDRYRGRFEQYPSQMPKPFYAAIVGITLIAVASLVATSNPWKTESSGDPDVPWYVWAFLLLYCVGLVFRAYRVLFGNIKIPRTITRAEAGNSLDSIQVTTSNSAAIESAQSRRSRRAP